MSSPSLRWVCCLTAALALAAGGVALSAPAQTVPKVEIAVDLSPESARLVLTHPQHLAYVVDAVPGKIRVRYDQSVELRPSEGNPNDRVLRRWSIPDGRTLVIETGPDFAGHESFELENPFRLVLDLRKLPPYPGARPARERGGKIDRREWDDLKERATAGQRGRDAAPVIVVDPGHGGVEQGAVGPAGLIEKDVTLALARRLKQVLEQGDRAVQVVLTRDDDQLAGLDERAGVANHNRADLFLSIHLNASPRPQARGAETYYLDARATDEEARILAGLENRATQDGGNVEDAGPPAPGSLDLVLWDLAQNQALAESSRLAESVQRQLNEVAGTPDRGVRQAPFRVLMGATMPAILVEVGFISNPEEERQFQAAEYRERVVQGLAAAVREYLAALKRLSPPAGRSVLP